MLVEAILRFKHARVMQVLKARKFTVKKLAEMSGWSQAVLGNFLRFQGVPQDKSKYPALFEALQVLDPTITYEEVFPECLKKAVEVFSTRRQTTEVDVLQLTNRSVDMLSIEDHSMHTDDLVNSHELTREMQKVLGGLPPREAKVLEMYFGLGGDGEKTLDEIGIALNVTRTRIGQIRERALQLLYRNPDVGKAMRDLYMNRRGRNITEKAENQDERFRAWLGYVPQAEIVTTGRSDDD